MNWRNIVFTRLRAPFAKRKLDAEMDEEMRSHIELRTRRNIDSGMSHEEARHAALRQFGHVDGIKETCRDQRVGLITGHLSLVSQDLRFSTRMLRKHPLTNGIIVLTIALLIVGVSVIYASFLGVREKLLPFPEPDRFVKFWRIGEKSVRDSFPRDLYAEYSTGLTSLEAIGALNSSEPRTLTGVGEARSYDVHDVSVNLLKLAGIPPLKGRLFDEADLDAESDHPIIISEQMWREKLGADENIIGRRLRLNDELHLVVGVMPASMRTTRLAWNADIWMPQRFRPHEFSQQPDGSLKPAQEQPPKWKTIVGVVRDPHPLTSNSQGKPEVFLDYREIRRGSADVLYAQTTANAKVMSHPLRNALQRLDALQPVEPPLFMADVLEERASFQRSTMMLLGGLGGVGLFMALMGVYGVVAFSVQERTREVGIRMAVGASRWDIHKLMLWQGARLIALGGLLGLLIGTSASVGLQDMFGNGLSAFDPVTCVIAIVVMGAGGLLASFFPARKAAQLNPMTALRYE